VKILNKVNGKISFGELFLVLGLVFATFLIAHFTLIDRLGFWRLIYPVQAQFAIWNIKCSENSPRWMQDSLKYMIQNQRTLSNQLAYVDQKNHSYSCQSGWVGHTLVSPATTENTRFRYASMTKLITNDAILQLVSQGKLKLDDRMIDYFDEIKGQKFKDDRIKKITIADLLQQALQLAEKSQDYVTRDLLQDVMFATDKNPWCPTQLQKLVDIKLDFDPNTRYAYDNRNACLLGVVIERVTKQNYRNYIAQQYPLLKKNIKFVDGAYYSDEVRYDFRNENLWMEGYSKQFDFYALSSAAGLSGSALSLAELIKPMLSHKPLNLLSIEPENLRQCKTTEFKSCNGYAMWQYQKTLNSPKLYYRNGGMPAVTSLAMVTEKQEVVVWVGNGATLYQENFDENLVERYFYQILSATNRF